MNKKFVSLIVVLFILFNVAGVFAKTGHMYLLAAEVRGNSTYGNLAELYLEIRPGSGRVFFQSYPLTKVDTQISTRFAKEFACDFLDYDCSKLDFFYTISSGGSIVGGPSAGAAMTVLTIAMLGNYELNPDVVMTGTISSSGMIGPVGAIKEKIDVAKRSGFKIVLIPKFSVVNLFNSDLNSSLNSSELNTSVVNASEPSINNSIFYYKNSFKKFESDTFKVIQISNINQALYYFLNKNFSSSQDFQLPDIYDLTMKRFANILCNRNIHLYKLLESVYSDKLIYNNSDAVFSFNNLNKGVFLKNDFFKNTFDNFSVKNILLRVNKSLNLSSNDYSDLLSYYNSSMRAMRYGKYYSAASFCFASNIIVEKLIFSNYSNDMLINELKRVDNIFNKINERLESEKIDSIIKLQTKQIVSERLIDALKKRPVVIDGFIKPSELSYYKERVFSALVWSNFFNIKQSSKKISDSTLLDLCKIKIMEAQERVGYIGSFYYNLSYFNEEIQKAVDLYNNKDYASCIYIASQAKAKIDLLINTLYIDKRDLISFFDEKYSLIKNKIALQLKKDMPIVAISYLQYSESLKDSDLYSALLYLEYASEFANLDMYFPNKHNFYFLKFYFEDKTFVIISFIFALFLTVFFYLVIFLFRLFFKKN